MSRNSSPTFKIVERKLYPNKAQEAQLETFRLECCKVYNRALEQRKKAYKRRKQTISLYDQQALLTQQRKRIPALKEAPRRVCQGRPAASRQGVQGILPESEGESQEEGVSQVQGQAQV